MTRGTIAFIFYNKGTDEYFLAVSPQFNGDMGPDMAKGEKLIKYFKDIYLNKKNHSSKTEKMEQIIERMMDEFEYDYGEKDYIRLIPLKKSKHGNVTIDLQTKYLNLDNKDIDYKNDVWSSWFDYSDYLYIVPLCDADNISIISENEDETVEEYILKKDYMDVLSFRSYVGFVSDDGQYYGKEQEKEDSDDGDDRFDCERPTKKYVEIVSEYKDGNCDCLVVRTVDNKHILFKEMK